MTSFFFSFIGVWILFQRDFCRVLCGVCPCCLIQIFTYIFGAFEKYWVPRWKKKEAVRGILPKPPHFTSPKSSRTSFPYKCYAIGFWKYKRKNILGVSGCLHSVLIKICSDWPCYKFCIVFTKARAQSYCKALQHPLCQACKLLRVPPLVYSTVQPQNNSHSDTATWKHGHKHLMITMPLHPEKQTAVTRDSSAILRMQDIFISILRMRNMVED